MTKKVKGNETAYRARTPICLKASTALLSKTFFCITVATILLLADTAAVITLSLTYKILFTYITLPNGKHLLV